MEEKEEVIASKVIALTNAVFMFPISLVFLFCHARFTPYNFRPDFSHIVKKFAGQE